MTKPKFAPMDGAMLAWAMEQEPIRYVEHYENRGNVVKSATALLYLAVGENDRQEGGAVRDRILEHLRSVVTGGNEPGFNAGPFWHYAHLSLAITLCRYTPTVWDCLTEDEKARLELFMECYAILTAFVANDCNTYGTGPALTGNYGKTWNPNHRMAMILPIVAASVYFSYGGKDGGTRVDEILTGFDHASYLARFEQYGFTRAYYNWATEGITLEDGRVTLGARELMMNGGDAILSHEDQGSIANKFPIGKPLGTGLGVRVPFTYHGAKPGDVAAIVTDLYDFNYSGGVVLSDSATIPKGLDENGNPLAYIADGTKSPYEGQIGMMKELISGDGGGGIRSSTSYCTHDFILVVSSFAALSSLGAYSLDHDSELFCRMKVGNGDLIYKNEHGYNSYSIGRSRGIAYDKDHPDYLPWKSWWLLNYGD